MLLPRSVSSERAPGVPEPEELWEAEMERLRGSGTPVRGLPYAMMDKRLIWQLREPAGVQTLRWQRWQRRRQTVERRLREAAQRLARGLGLWEGALYEIGGLFGTGIRSYFTFLRFLLLLNLLSLLLTASFVLLPLVWLRPPDPGPTLNLTLQCPGSRQSPPGVLRFHNQLWHVLTGRAFTNTYLFYGAYRVGPESSSVYSIRLAYLLSPLACLLLCFCGTLRRMVKGLPQKTLLGQGYQAPLSAKVFSSWDFCIRVQEAATIKKHEISNEFKVELEEGRRFQLMQQQTRAQTACRLLSYLRVNVLNGLLVVGAISAIFWATKYSQDNKEESLFLLLQYLPPGVIALVNFLGPLLFTFLVQLENYPPNTEVNLTLIWCVVLKLASLGMFSVSLGQTILCIGRDKSSCESYGYNVCDYQCWENSVGEELYKLSIFNFLLTVAFAFLVTLPRRLLVDRFSGRFWAWLEREEFLVPKNVLDIVAGQTVTWMGLFYCPLLPLLNSVFLFLTFYIKKYTLLKNSRASSRPFRASSSTFFFQLVLLLGLLLAAVPLGYVVSSIHSSWDCGLFTNYSAPWQVVPELVALGLPPIGQRALHYLGSHAFSFPLLIMLSLVLTVCVSQTQANARAIHRLRKQLVWQVQEKWHLVEDLSRLLPEPGPSDSPGPKYPASQASRPQSFCPGCPCPGSPGHQAPRPGPSVVDAAGLRSPCPGQHGAPASARRFRFPSGAEL
ncbi:transmembrane channel-like protein 8 [Homo sapiens]|uniref:Transmembrane channel-like protein 8 n=3 Tax=Homo sapiens TaxID=9606 RepID=TMC8_HUMAN|nr:transmembrane channel-like protein 8 [Homo sapiens]Q8IU68.1 RecName: Full=Transmembrane channel-like protein 8; AltName: Full=Epidermodysplasia verruciformis protein 2 [Homo sapiens]AAI10297.1 Transmembrane channel-like 8 [Homo sapiens]AAL25837.1 Evin2 [Homo sapiens]AAM44454.1 large EVER2 protein [Homo sapiens]AAP69878.1 transmembrane channel-like protein 8 [Homo sapiens]EAW89494.1 transmembrane channel-like 8, isoform CRA_a [Homo sapiens]|eukprot:NP_689681.2 transmembrane channel-like protein 8 [Homo sapiens]